MHEPRTSVFRSMQAVVFDLDETLIDRRESLSRYAECLHAEFRSQTTMAIAEFVAEFHRLDDNGRVSRDQFFDSLASRTFSGTTAEQLRGHFESRAWQSPQLFPGIRDTLLHIRTRGWRIGIITNGGVRSQTDKIKNSGLSELVHYSVISDAFGSRKPDKAIFQHVVVQLSIDPSRSWFVGDDPHADIWGAKQVGFRTIWIERYIRWPDDLPACYDARISHVSDLLQLIQNT